MDPSVGAVMFVCGMLGCLFFNLFEPQKVKVTKSTSDIRWLPLWTFSWNIFCCDRVEPSVHAVMFVCGNPFGLQPLMRSQTQPQTHTAHFTFTAANLYMCSQWKKNRFKLLFVFGYIEQVIICVWVYLFWYKCCFTDSHCRLHVHWC